MKTRISECTKPKENCNEQILDNVNNETNLSKSNNNLMDLGNRKRNCKLDLERQNKKLNTKSNSDSDQGKFKSLNSIISKSEQVKTDEVNNSIETRKSKLIKDGEKNSLNLKTESNSSQKVKNLTFEDIERKIFEDEIGGLASKFNGCNALPSKLAVQSKKRGRTKSYKETKCNYTNNDIGKYKNIIDDNNKDHSKKQFKSLRLENKDKELIKDYTSGVVNNSDSSRKVNDRSKSKLKSESKLKISSDNHVRMSLEKDNPVASNSSVNKDKGNKSNKTSNAKNNFEIKNEVSIKITSKKRKSLTLLNSEECSKRNESIKRLKSDKVIKNSTKSNVPVECIAQNLSEKTKPNSDSVNNSKNYDDENKKNNSKLAKRNRSINDNQNKTNQSCKGQSSSMQKHTKSPKHSYSEKKKISKLHYESDSDLSDWEEVDEFAEILKSGEDIKDFENNVKIELASEDFWSLKKKRKRRTEQELFEDFLRKQVNKSIREVALNVHKTHLLCLLAHGLYLNNLICSDEILEQGRSLLPKKYYSPKRVDMDHLEKFLSWFCKTIKIDNEESDENFSFDIILKERFEKKSARNNKELVSMFVATSRAAGMTVRLVQNLSPISWKPDFNSLLKPKKKENEIDEENTPSGSLGSSLKTENKDKQSTKPSVADPTTSTTPKPESIKNTKSKRRKCRPNTDNSDNGDEDFELSKTKGETLKKKRKSNSNSPVEGKKKHHQLDVFNDWVEVFVEEEEMWVSVDVKRNKYHCTAEIEVRCSNLAYVVAFNQDRCIKDVTKRYVSNWLAIGNKIHCDENWWNDSIRPFVKEDDKRQKKEDKEMEEKLKEQPMPKSITEYKSHPLYALRRHLLKFETIYPPDIEFLGYVKGEAVYPRSAVKTLRSKDIWFKEAKSIRVGEEPYNIVKGRPKWDKNLCQMVKERMLELYGEWQLEDYEPPVAVDGKVPRNEYGNVDLFKSCMLPRGCVHLPINGLGRVARKLSIDCAAAVVGFEYQGGGSYPVLDGFVVCEEFKDIILDAWNEEQVEIARKAEEKRINRIFNTWKKFIKGIVLKDRLKEKYGVIKEENNQSETTSKNRKVKQNDLDELPSTTTIVHPIVNLKIDMDSSVVDKHRSRVASKRWRVSQKVSKCDDGRSPKKNLKTERVPSSDSEQENLNPEEKQEKIRAILQWNPNKTDCRVDEPALSDDSEDDNESKTGIHQLPSSKPPTSQISRLKSSTRTKSKTKKKSVSSRKLISRKFDDSDSDFEDTGTAKPVLRPSRTTKINKDISYKESDKSQSDISIDESDTEDKPYNPP